MRKAVKRALIIIGSILGMMLAAYLGFCAYVCLVVFDNPFDDKSFDQQTWMRFRGSDDPDNPRGQMVEDLRERFVKREMPKEEIVRLLGEPDFDKTDRCLKYNLGAWSGFRIDYDSLDIEFDARGRLARSRVVQH